MVETGYFIYATVIKLSMLVAGLTCVVLGYYLFQKVASPPDSKTDVGVDFLKKRFTIRNAAPGTLFALFGAAVIGMVVFTGQPSITFQPASGQGQTASAAATAPGRTTIANVIRANQNSKISSILQQYYGGDFKSADEALRAIRDVVNESSGQ